MFYIIIMRSLSSIVRTDVLSTAPDKSREEGKTNFSIVNAATRWFIFRDFSSRKAHGRRVKCRRGFLARFIRVRSRRNFHFRLRLPLVGADARVRYGNNE